MDFIKTYLWSLGRLRTERVVGSFLSLTSLALAAIQLFEPVFFGRVVDRLSGGLPIGRTLLIWAGLGISGALVNVAIAIVADRLAHRQRMAALTDAFARVIALPPGAHVARGSGKLTRVIFAGADQVFFLWLTLFREHLTSFLSLALLVPMALAMDQRLAGLLFVLAVLYGVSNWLIIRRTHGLQRVIELRHQDMAGQMTDVIGHVAVIQSFDRVGREVQALRQMATETLRHQYPVLTWWGVLNTITRVASTLALMAIVSYGAVLVTRGQVTAGQVVTFAGFSSLLIGRLDQISSFFARAVGQAPALHALFTLMNESGGEEAHRSVRSNVRGAVEFRGVAFSYGPGAAGVGELNFSAKPGETVALVGPSGAGKTTCLGLLQGLITPTAGQVLIDERPLTDFTLAERRAAIATVFQDAQLLNRSVAENLRVGDPDASGEQLAKAATQAEAHDFITARPEGYDFRVGERGLALSGGERQRVALARAVLKDAPILILDEATSALDNETEERVQAAIEAISRSRTTFVIAHRLSTIVHADRILVMERGRIVQQGTFDELALRPGLFRRLLEAGRLGPEPTFDSAHA